MKRTLNVVLSLSIATLINLQIVASYICPRDGWGHVSTHGSCCDSEPFFPGDGRVEFAEDCFLEPMDDTLPYKENHWAFYECVVKKSLSNNYLTEPNFVELMTRNMSEAKRTAIKDFLKQDIGSLEPGEGSSSRQMLKFLWKRYMDAEFSVCAVIVQDRCKKNNDAQESRKCLKTGRRMYEPRIFCRQDGEALWANPQKYTEDQHNECFENQTAVLKPFLCYHPCNDYNSKKKLLDAAFFLCTLSSTAPFRLQDLYTPNADFEKFFKFAAPRFLSSTSRGLLIKAIIFVLSKQGIQLDPAAPFQNFVRVVKNGDRINELGPNEQMMVNLEALMLLVNLTQQAQAYVCQQQWPHKY